MLLFYQVHHVPDQIHLSIRVLIVALVQAHPPQGGLISVVRRQVVVRPGSGLVGAVCVRFEEERGMLLTEEDEAGCQVFAPKGTPLATEPASW